VKKLNLFLIVGFKTRIFLIKPYFLLTPMLEKLTYFVQSAIDATYWTSGANEFAEPEECLKYTSSKVYKWCGAFNESQSKIAQDYFDKSEYWSVKESEPPAGKRCLAIKKTADSVGLLHKACDAKNSYICEVCYFRFS